MYQIVFITVLLYESIKGLNKFIRIIIRNESLLIIKKIELPEVNQMKIGQEKAFLMECFLIYIRIRGGDNVWI